ncbi:MAG: XdhC family protein, partial [Exilispira sp.]
ACGGLVTIFFEFFDTLTLSIFGAGHIGQNLVDIIKKMGYKIQLFDVREDFLNQFSEIDEVKKYLLKPIDKDNNQLFYVDEKPLSDFLQDGSFVVITTHGHAYDFSIAKYILSIEKKFKYIGMVASKNKVSQFIEKLKSENKNIYEKFLSSNFYSPIGLDIGGFSAREIALSIASQIQSIRYGKNINSLSII